MSTHPTIQETAVVFLHGSLLHFRVTFYAVKDVIDQLQTAIAQCLGKDRFLLRQKLGRIERMANEQKPFDHLLTQLGHDIQQSKSIRDARIKSLPKPTYPADLPVVGKKDDIARTIAKNQVTIICGETGSGKTTQLPKILLELGRGVDGMIGHTQPRRIAARSVAARIASELNTPLGHTVGYKVRFSDRISNDTCIKLMTDGILLAETTGDRFLNNYDTLIIDEAHERSLNIDFLLGYLKQLLPKRPDLKIIITSATIDPQRFSRHFNNAPIVEVSGRTFPVEVRYRPIQSEDPEMEDVTQIQGILDAIDELWRDAPGDTLVFLSGEREIRETAEALRKHHPPGVQQMPEVLPLYAKLSADDQNRIFSIGSRRRIILTTNVAETSLTVPGIKYVIDSGYARISRYSPRTKVQRLPIERISRASANQRMGRCGRISDGICIRLYSLADFESQIEFTEPEIQRTNLASVILQMTSLRLGDVGEFPFVEPPDYRMIKDGYHTLHEIRAIDDSNQLTDLGRELARLPIDPRIGTMLLASRDEQCIGEMLIIASALCIPDPRERPMDKQDAADTAHSAFRDVNSDFLGFLKIWNWFIDRQKHLSNSKLRRACHDNFISYVRMREWIDIHHQLHSLVAEIGVEKAQTKNIFEASVVQTRSQDRSTRNADHSMRNPAVTNPAMDVAIGRTKKIIAGKTNADPLEELHNRPGNIVPAKFDSIHRSILLGLLGNIGLKGDGFEYTGARGSKFSIFPGSSLFSARPKWIVAGELVETTRLYARTVARIQPEWIERLAEHLIKRSHTDPRWQPERGYVVASEKVSLYGLIVVPQRSVHYGPINPKESREIFIRCALVERDWRTTAPFFRHNLSLIEQIQTIEAKSRRTDILVDQKVIFDFYDRRIPAGIYNVPLFEKWRNETERRDSKCLFMSRRDLMRHGADEITADAFPDFAIVNDHKLAIEYDLDPGNAMDGVTLVVPLKLIDHISPARFEWLVPGLLREKIVELIRTLPKSVRVTFVPVTDTADAAVAKLKPSYAPLLDSLVEFLGKKSGSTVLRSDFDFSAIPSYLFMNYRVIDENRKTLAVGRDLNKIRAELGLAARDSLAAMPKTQYTKDNLQRWDFGDLPISIEVKRDDMTFLGYPALIDKGNSVSLMLLDTADNARVAMKTGIRRLFMVQLREDLKQIERSIPRLDAMSLNYSTIGNATDLRADFLTAVADRALCIDGDPSAIRAQAEFVKLAEAAWRRLHPCANELSGIVARVLRLYQPLQISLSGAFAPLMHASVLDMKQQLAHLVFKGFITRIPSDRMDHLPRFIEGIADRLKKLMNAGLSRDQKGMETVSPYWMMYLTQLEKHRKENIVDQELIVFRWMIEEFRISIFAQELGTSQPISSQRMDRQWEKVKR